MYLTHTTPTGKESGQLLVHIPEGDKSEPLQMAGEEAAPQEAGSTLLDWEKAHTHLKIQYNIGRANGRLAL